MNEDESPRAVAGIVLRRKNRSKTERGLVLSGIMSRVIVFGETDVLIKDVDLYAGSGYDPRRGKIGKTHAETVLNGIWASGVFTRAERETAKSRNHKNTVAKPGPKFDETYTALAEAGMLQPPASFPRDRLDAAYKTGRLGGLTGTPLEVYVAMRCRVDLHGVYWGSDAETCDFINQRTVVDHDEAEESARAKAKPVNKSTVTRARQVLADLGWVSQSVHGRGHNVYINAPIAIGRRTDCDTPNAPIATGQRTECDTPGLTMGNDGAYDGERWWCSTTPSTSAEAEGDGASDDQARDVAPVPCPGEASDGPTTREDDLAFVSGGLADGYSLLELIVDQLGLDLEATAENYSLAMEAAHASVLSDLPWQLGNPRRMLEANFDEWVAGSGDFRPVSPVAIMQAAGFVVDQIAEGKISPADMAEVHHLIRNTARGRDSYAKVQREVQQVLARIGGPQALASEVDDIYARSPFLLPMALVTRFREVAKLLDVDDGVSYDDVDPKKLAGVGWPAFRELEHDYLRSVALDETQLEGDLWGGFKTWLAARSAALVPA